METGGNVATQEVDILAEIAKDSKNYNNYFKLAVLEITLSIWFIVYLFFSAKLLGLTILFISNWVS